MKLKPKCFGTNRRDNSLICQTCDFDMKCLWEHKDRQYNEAQQRVMDDIDTIDQKVNKK